MPLCRWNHAMARCYPSRADAWNTLGLQPLRARERLASRGAPQDFVDDISFGERIDEKSINDSFTIKGGAKFCRSWKQAGVTVRTKSQIADSLEC